MIMKPFLNLWFFEWMHVWMHENLWFAFTLNALMNAWYIFTCLTSLTFPLGNECMTLCWCVKFWLAWDHFTFNAWGFWFSILLLSLNQIFFIESLNSLIELWTLNFHFGKTFTNLNAWHKNINTISSNTLMHVCRNGWINKHMVMTC